MTTRRRDSDLLIALGTVGVLLAGWCFTVFAVVTTAVPSEYGIDHDADDAPATHLESFGFSAAVVMQLATALIVGALLVRLSGTAPQARLRTAIITALTVAALLAAPSALRSFIQRTLESESAEGGWRLLLQWLAILSLVFFAAAAPRIGAPAAGIATVCAAIGGIIIGAAGQTFFDQLLIVNDSHEVVVHFAAVLALPAVLPLIWLVAAPMAWLWHSNQVD